MKIRVVEKRGKEEKQEEPRERFHRRKSSILQNLDVRVGLTVFNHKHIILKRI